MADLSPPGTADLALGILILALALALWRLTGNWLGWAALFLPGAFYVARGWARLFR